MDGEMTIGRGSWWLTPEGEDEAERKKRQLGEAALLRLAELAAPIKQENDDPLFDLL